MLTRTQALSISLPAAMVAIRLVTVIVADRSPRQSLPSHAAAVDHSLPAASEQPKVTLNGQPVTLNEQGTADVPTAGGTTHVTRQGDATTVTTTTGSGTSSTTTGTGDVHITVTNTSDNAGSSFTRSDVFQSTSGYSSSDSQTTVTQHGAMTTTGR